MATDTYYSKIHLNVPKPLYRKLQEQAMKDHRPVTNMVLVLIEKGLDKA